jgi:hypothetical protein
MAYVITALVSLAVGFGGGAVCAYLYTAKLRAAGKAALATLSAKV